MVEKVVVNLNILDDKGNVVDGATSEMTHKQISDVVDHAAQLILIRRAARRSSGDMEYALSDLEEVLVDAGVIDKIEALARAA